MNHTSNLAPSAPRDEAGGSLLPSREGAELEQALEALGRSRAQLLDSERMAALGRVTAGIAHDINSPLGSILNSLRIARGYVEEYRTSLGDPEVTLDDHAGIAEDIANALSLAERSARKVAQIVQTIKGRSRAGEGVARDFDPAEETDTVVSLLQHESRSRGVGVYADLERGLRLHGDPARFGLAVQNLVVNAMDAYDGAPGEVWVRLRGEADHVRLAVEDRGCGIPAEIRGRIFEFQFTTKEVGRGTGLGLALVHGVATDDYGGSVEVESEPGVGTTLSLRLPLPAAEVAHGS